MSRIKRFSLMICVAALPAIVTITLLYWTFGLGPNAHTPAINDDHLYWQEYEAFRAVGFNSGYFTFGELTAPAPFIRFGSHGPFHAMLIGSIARLTGWAYESMAIYNLVMVTAALFLFMLLTQPKGRQWSLIALLGVTWYPLIIFLPTTMLEALQHTFAIVLAGLFALRLRRSDRDRWVGLAAWVVIVMAALTRITWVFTLIPLLFIEVLDAEPVKRRRVLLRTGLTLVIGTGVVIGIFVYTTPSWPPGFLYIWRQQLSAPPAIGIRMLFERFFSSFGLLDTTGPLYVSMRIAIFSLVGIGFYNLLPISRQFRIGGSSQRESWFVCLALSPVLVVLMTFYEVQRDLRIFAPHVFMVLLVLTVLNRIRLIQVFVALNLISWIWMAHAFVGYNYPQFSFDRTNLMSFRQEVGESITYDPTAKSGWCNTLLIYDYFPEFMALPSGIGTAYYFDIPNNEAPPKSLYLLIDTPKRAEKMHVKNTQLLTKTRLGTIYRNLDAQCDH